MMEPFQMHIVALSGTPRQRGKDHGEQMRNEIERLFDFGRTALKQAGGPPMETVGAAFIQSTGHLQAAKKWTPDLVEELGGIAEGAGVDFGVLWTFQCQDESYWFNTSQLGLFPRRMDPDRCSSLGAAATTGHPTLLGQNLDTPSLYHGRQTLLHIRYPDGRKSYVITEPGLVGICGMNSSPLGVCQNTLAIRLNYDPDGLPAMLVARSLIDLPDLETARRFLNEIPHASGINYMLADSHTVEDYECSANRVERYQPSIPGRLAHTNHPLASQDKLEEERLSETTRALQQVSRQHSQSRMACLDSRFYNAGGDVNVETFKEVLSSHQPPEFPVCRHPLPDSDPMRGMTNNSLIMSLGEPPHLHLTSGPPCYSEYRVFSF
jgi:isopenicillin-N N-acyltransferase like protein